jgi:hypothetical protein
MERFDYIKVVEIESKHGWYHAHMHVIVPDQVHAELLNCAWQNTRAPFQPTNKRGQPYWCQTFITAPDSGTTHDAARYVTKYVSKALNKAVQRGLRWLDAGGLFRPLGLALPPCTDKPVAIWVGGWIADPREFFAGVGYAWKALIATVNEDSRAPP